MHASHHLTDTDDRTYKPGALVPSRPNATGQGNTMTATYVHRKVGFSMLCWHARLDFIVDDGMHELEVNLGRT